MTDILKFLSVLENQHQNGIKTMDWDNVKDYNIKIEKEDNTINIVLKNIEIGFCFDDKTKKLKGIYNFKQ